MTKRFLEAAEIQDLVGDEQRKFFFADEEETEEETEEKDIDKGGKIGV
jgi:hypothetical protein